MFDSLIDRNLKRVCSSAEELLKLLCLVWINSNASLIIKYLLDISPHVCLGPHSSSIVVSEVRYSGDALAVKGDRSVVDLEHGFL